MRLMRLVTAAACTAALFGVALAARQEAPPARRMADAASALLRSLPPELRQKASFPADGPERLDWHFVPMQNAAGEPTRKGVGLYELDDSQREAMIDLLKAGTSEKGLTQARAIMSLESILDELESGGSVRDPQWYFAAVFGEPGDSGKWGWRLEGHHLSVNFLIEDGRVVATTPLFFGANPAEVKSGGRQGLRAIPEVEDLAVKLFQSLRADQRERAYRREHFPEVTQTVRADVGEPAGLPAAEMDDVQREQLVGLLRAYADRMPAELASREMARVREAGVEKIHFAFTGGTGRGEPHTYRVQGPTFVVEFLNTQADSAGNPANHIHSVWRRLPADFGVEG